jgi:hypothetical protein
VVFVIVVGMTARWCREWNAQEERTRQSVSQPSSSPQLAVNLLYSQLVTINERH